MYVNEFLEKEQGKCKLESSISPFFFPLPVSLCPPFFSFFLLNSFPFLIFPFNKHPNSNSTSRIRLQQRHPLYTYGHLLRIGG